MLYIILYKILCCKQMFMVVPQFSAEECGTSKSCLRDPVNCDPKTDLSCNFLSFRTAEQGVQFELSGPADGYVSFALSFDKWMVSGNRCFGLCIVIVVAYVW